jgi:hypothetical protein
MRKQIEAIALIGLACASIVGCTTATATKTSKDGSTDSIKVQSFLSTIQNGSYSNGTGMALSVSSATPDQQSIAILAGTVGDIAKAGMLLAAKPTNSATPTEVIVTNVIQIPKQ